MKASNQTIANIDIKTLATVVGGRTVGKGCCQDPNAPQIPNPELPYTERSDEWSYLRGFRG